MEIHKPRSVHSFREFLSELGVVVLGIVIALSGEQLIEHMRDGHKASEARTGIRDEIGMNIAVLLSRSSTQSCIDQRIDEIGRLLDASDTTNYVAPLWLGRPQIWEMLHARWQVVSQAGRAPLLAPEEQAGYGFVYALFADVAADEDREQLAWARMRALEGLAHPSEAMKAELRLALQEARLTNWDIKNLNRGLQSRAAQMAIPKQAMPRQQPDSGICFPMSTPRAEALNRLTAGTGYRVEEP
jgi:hypothetical protein